MPDTSTTFILASGSPRRQEMLRQLGLNFQVMTADIDETPLKGETPKIYVARVALEKARKIAAQNTDLPVLAADTTVTVGRRILGKPEDKDEAADMLRLMRGRRHRVLTTVCCITPDGTEVCRTSQTAVTMRPLTEKDIQRYVSTPENWQGLAGAYGLQTAVGGALVSRINGSHSGVIGLPLVETLNLLKGCGLDV